MRPDPAVIGPWAPATALSRCLATVGVLLSAGCGGDLAHRSVAEFQGQLAIPEGIRTVRIEIANGSVGVDVHDDQSLSYAGGAKRAADSAEALAELEAVVLELAAERDPEDPSIWIVRGPTRPPGASGMLALELRGLRLPPDLAVDVEVTQNGNVYARGRQGPLTVTTGRGDLRFEHCSGAITARTGRGMVIAFDHRGDIDIETGIGDMQVFVREPADRIRLDTGQGTVQCYVPPTTGFRLDSRAEIGRCGSSFGFEAESPSQFSSAMIGARGDERTRIVLRTGKGHLSLGSKTFE